VIRSALEIVVEHEMHVLNQLPIFEQLIDIKWKSFGLRHHLVYVVAPYLLFFVIFNIALLQRCGDIEDAFFNENAAGEEVLTLPIRVRTLFCCRES